jgi:hypothetical protein
MPAPCKQIAALEFVSLAYERVADESFKVDKPTETTKTAETYGA